MEKKRYQVFVSSTYADLIDERKALFDTVSKVDCIPAGMESFPAFDAQQLDYIKSVIDDSDYYVLVIAGRYGSVSEQKISFTESEYDYAIEKNIPVLSFLHADPQALPVNKTDQDPTKKEALSAFIDRVKNGRLVKFWKNTDELSLQVTQSLISTIKAKPGVGWVRGNVSSSYESLEEINKLRKENSQLLKQIESEKEVSSSYPKQKTINSDALNEIWILKFDGRTKQFTVEMTARDFLRVIGPAYYSPASDSYMDSALKSYLQMEKGMYVYDATIVEYQKNIILAKFTTWGFFEERKGYVLTPAGKTFVMGDLARARL